jgi:hypothetical protein
LRDRVLEVIDTDGDPFWYEGLAPRISDPSVVEALEERVTDPHRSDEVHRRAAWALNAIDRSRPRGQRVSGDQR